MRKLDKAVQFLPGALQRSLLKVLLAYLRPLKQLSCRQIVVVLSLPKAFTRNNTNCFMTIQFTLTAS